MMNYESEYKCPGKTKNGEPCSFHGSHLIDGKWYCGHHNPGGKKPAKTEYILPYIRPVIMSIPRFLLYCKIKYGLE